MLGLQRLSPRAAPWVFVFLWSSGFTAAKYVHPYAGPFTFLALRYTIACGILAAAAAWQRQLRSLTSRQVWHSALTGLLLHAVYIGGVFYAISQGVTAGISSVIVSLQPVLVALLAVPLLGERFHWVGAAGLALGVVGVALLLLPKVLQGDYSSQFTAVGIGSCVVALLGTTAGYLTQKRVGGGIPFLPGTAVQFAASAVTFMVLAGLTEDMTIQWTPQFIAGLTWIVVALSIGSIFLLFELLRAGTAGSVSSLYYLVPPCAALQSYLLLGEHIPPIGLVGMALAALGVMLVMRSTEPAAH